MRGPLAGTALLAAAGVNAFSARSHVVDVVVTCAPDGWPQAITTPRGTIRWGKEDGDQARADAIKRLLPDRRVTVRMTNLAETPYKCIGGFIFALQRLGYRHVTFVAEPPPVSPPPIT